MVLDKKKVNSDSKSTFINVPIAKQNIISCVNNLNSVQVNFYLLRVYSNPNNYFAIHFCINFYSKTHQILKLSMCRACRIFNKFRKHRKKCCQNCRFEQNFLKREIWERIKESSWDNNCLKIKFKWIEREMKS